MQQGVFQWISSSLDEFTEQAGDEDRLQKNMLVASTLMISTLAIFWGLLYIYLGETVAGLIPLSYAVLSYLSLYIFFTTRRYQFFRSSQLLLSLLLPFFLMIALGGFVNSSAVILWSLTSPLGALLFASRRQATRWFIAYIVLVIASGFLEVFARPSNNLPPALIVAFFVLNITALSSVAFVLLQYFIRQKDLAFGLVRVEQEKSERLLLNVLPKEIAATLKNGDHTIAERFESASVLFADVVGFTSLSTEMSPEGMVNLLNEVFSYFDTLVEKYGLEKIRTIGDNYMVAAGVPRPRPDHAQALAAMALEMCNYLDEAHGAGIPLNFRIGINSGPMIGGVIGKQKFHYDVWGDTVNTASRMESHGVPGKIQITQATHDLICDEFECSPRGTIQIKGKGEMQTWFVEGKK
jgi:guanylate cyclase